MSTFPDGFREQAAGESLCLRERKMVLLVCVQPPEMGGRFVGRSVPGFAAPDAFDMIKRYATGIQGGHPYALRISAFLSQRRRPFLSRPPKFLFLCPFP